MQLLLSNAAMSNEPLLYNIRIQHINNAKLLQSPFCFNTYTLIYRGFNGFGGSPTMKFASRRQLLEESDLEISETITKFALVEVDTMK